MSNNTETFIIKINDKGVVSGLKRAGDETDKTKKKVGGLNKSMRIFGGILAGISIGALGKEVIDTLAQFEKFEAVLTNTFGSNSEAKKALAEITDFAATTPFQIDELTGSFVKLANRGFRPTMAEMLKMGDLASSTGKGFDQLTEAVLDAQTGEFERLKEFGITARKEGDKVAFSFKNQTKEVKFSDSAIKDYILSLGDLNGVSGATAAIAATTGGQISMLQDRFTGLKLLIGEKLRPQIGGLISGLSSTVDALKSAINWLSSGSAGAEIFIAVLSGLTAGILVYNGIVQAQILWTKAITAAQWLWNAAMTANPIGLIVAGIVILGTAVYVAYKRFDKFRAIVKGSWAALKSLAVGVKNTFLGLPVMIVKAFSAIPKAIGEIFGGVKELMKAIFSGNFSEVPDILKKIVSGNAVSGVLKDFAKDRLQDGKDAAGAFKTGYNDEMDASALARKEKAADEAEINSKKTTFDPVTGGSTGKDSSLKAGLSEVRSSAPKNFVINIESLIKEQNINTTNLKESTQKIKDLVTNVLLTAVNDSQIIAE